MSEVTLSAVHTAVQNLSGNMTEFGKRLDNVEATANTALSRGTEALTKVDALAARQIESQKLFTDALREQTAALKALSKNLTDRMGSMRGLVLIVLVLLGAPLLAILILLARLAH